MVLKRIALIGTSSVGKTTVFELLKNKLPKYEFISETTRTVNSYNFPINEQGVDSTQLAISNLHLYNLTLPYNLILDRCYLDLLVYSYLLKNVSDNTRSFVTDMWYKIKDHYTHLIYFPIEFKVVDDGVRSINEEWREEVDAQFKYELERYDKDYLTISGSPMQRVNQIMKYIKEDER